MFHAFLIRLKPTLEHSKFCPYQINFYKTGVVRFVSIRRCSAYLAGCEWPLFVKNLQSNPSLVFKILFAPPLERSLISSRTKTVCWSRSILFITIKFHTSFNCKNCHIWISLDCSVQVLNKLERKYFFLIFLGYGRLSNGMPQLILWYNDLFKGIKFWGRKLHEERAYHVYNANLSLEKIQSLQSKLTQLLWNTISTTKVLDKIFRRNYIILSYW